MRKINLKKKKMKIVRRRYVDISPLQPLERLTHVSTKDDGKEKKARVRNVVSKWDYTDDNRQDYERTDAITSKETEQVTTFRRFMDEDNEKKLVYE